MICIVTQGCMIVHYLIYDMIFHVFNLIYDTFEKEFMAE